MDIKRNIKFIVVDLDGTLLNDEHVVSDKNKETIKKAIAQGIKVIIATGKTRTSAESVIAALNLDTPGVFVQGLMIYNADGTVRQEHKLDADVARHAIQFAEAQGFEVIAYSGNRLVCKRLDESIEEVAKFGEPMPEEIGSLINQVNTVKMNKLMIVGGNRRKLKSLRWQLTQQIGGKVSFTDGGAVASLEILPKGASKGQGVKALLRQLAAKPENVMAIGDAENDIEMLQTVGFGVAVQNASEKTKAVAAEIVSSNNDNGVAEAIERFVLVDEPEAKVTPETPAESTETTEPATTTDAVASETDSTSESNDA